MIKRQNPEWIYHVSNENPLFFILGPCVIENELDTLRAAEKLSNLATALDFKLVFKGSFDKANRTSYKSFRGVSLEKGLAILARVQNEFGLPVMTDVHETTQVAQVGAVVDILQIPAFLCRQTDLLNAAAKTGKPVHIKKGQFEAPESMEHVVEKIKANHNDHAWLCERGFTFGYNNLVVDYRSFPIMKQFHCPITFDVSHAVQCPGGFGNASSGKIEFIKNLSAAAVVQGIAGMYIMIHEKPEKALCCNAVSISIEAAKNLIMYLKNIDTLVKAKN